VTFFKTGAFEKQGRSLKIFTFKIGILKNEVPRFVKKIMCAEEALLVVTFRDISTSRRKAATDFHFFCATHVHEQKK
jgi:hypothetical protein